MCKTCGCAATTQQLCLKVKGKRESAGFRTLYDSLLGAPGILHVEMDEKSGQVLVDFSPQRNTRHVVEDIVGEQGYIVLEAEVRNIVHQHGVSGLIKRILGK